MKKRIAVIYHSADFDGKLSREVCMHWIERLWPDADVIAVGWDYGQPPPSVMFSDHEGESFPNDIYIVDLSIDDIMQSELLRDRVIWIDHHRSAIEQYKDTPFKGYRIDGVAACRLAWQYFAAIDFNRRHRLNDEPKPEQLPDKQWFVDRDGEVGCEPLVIRMAGEYDVFDHRDERALPFQFGLTILEADPGMWQRAISEWFRYYDMGTIDRCVEQGTAAMHFINAQNANLIPMFGHDVRFCGLTFLCINNWRFNSQTFDRGRKPQHDAMMGWRHNGDGNCTVSLYGWKDRQDLDLSKIASHFGGGGHKHACGMRFTLEEMTRVLKGVVLPDNTLAGVKA